MTEQDGGVFRVEDQRGRVVLRTDDWVEACSAALSSNWPRGGQLYVRGTHPTHNWGPPHAGQEPPDPRCTACGAWDNGSYGSQSPCGYDWSNDALVTALWRETQERKSAAS